jgi:hypothetical protein
MSGVPLNYAVQFKRAGASVKKVRTRFSSSMNNYADRYQRA